MCSLVDTNVVCVNVNGHVKSCKCKSFIVIHSNVFTITFLLGIFWALYLNLHDMHAYIFEIH